MTKEEWYKQLFERLGNSKFRSSFHLKQKDIDYINEKGLDYYKTACAGLYCKAGSSGGYSKRWKTDADERASGIYRTACNCNLLQGVHPKMA